MRLHVVGLPHTQITRAFDWCAYTAKLRRLPLMLAAQGHEVILYAADETDSATRVACSEVAEVVGPAERARWFGGDWDPDRVFDRWDSTDPCWVEMNARAVGEIAARIGPGDGIGLIAGRCQEMLARSFPDHPAVEWGVGYEGVLDGSHRAFESHAWRHYVAGTRREGTGRFFDAVIPNAYDPSEFQQHPAGDYLLFLGRHTERKGLEVVRELARRHRVITAGQDGPLDGAEYYGVVLGAEKAELIARARAVLVPTFYVEPFGGVAVEAQLSGVPVITTDFGAFPETVEDGVTGFRCSTLGEFVRAADEIGSLNRPTVRTIARRHFTLEAVAPLYGRWLRRLEQLAGDGWYEGTRSAASPRRADTMRA